MTMTSTTGVPAYEAPTAGKAYQPGSPDGEALVEAVREARTGVYELPCLIGGHEVRTGRTYRLSVPHHHPTSLGVVHHGSAEQITAAIDAADQASRGWANTPWQERASIFLRAADLLEHTGWRERLVAATQLELSKTLPEADGDAGCETVDFIRANVANLARMVAEQPSSVHGVTNEVEYRPLEGFVFAVSPFNFTSMNNLAFGPALLGNTVVWKPAEAAALVAHLSLELLIEAGLPDGVINLVHGSGAELGPTALAHPDLAAVAFTGSTATFQGIWSAVGSNIRGYRSYPRLVGETGGKGFVAVHPSADAEAVADACIRAAYGYQGQKCSAASRLYVPREMWPTLRDLLIDRTRALRMGDPTELGVDLGAVISERQFRKQAVTLAKAQAATKVLAGGRVDDRQGWFVDPTLLETDDARSEFMTEEFFAPILTCYAYDSSWGELLDLVDRSSIYGLTGAVFASDDRALAEADDRLRFAAGNYYVNDKPSGAIVGQQPFGGARASGTDDKVGTVWNLIRYTAPRTIKTKHLG